jgi:sigma-B regulation protein RsbU (phosphoserine phosphatase)
MALRDSWTLLVVDDDEANRTLLVRRLAREGYTHVLTAADGAEALALLRGRAIDLVLLDVMMPGLDGYQVLEALRADERLRHVPVIMISALDRLDSAVRCIELGAEDYLTKPFDPVLLRARVAATLEKKRLRDEIAATRDRLAHELRAARAMQLAMVPATFPAPTAERPVEVFASLQPAREVGGDLYDFFWRDARTFCFVVGDVSGKGAGAALHMARTRTLIRQDARLTSCGLEELATMVNAELAVGNTAVTFVTAVLGILDVPSGVLRVCNAGHPPPYVVDAEGAVTRLDSGPAQLPLGMDETTEYTAVERMLAPGETLFLYTDGLVEAKRDDGARFGEARLDAALAGLAGASAEATVATALDAVAKFMRGASCGDDVAVMAIRLTR